MHCNALVLQKHLQTHCRHTADTLHRLADTLQHLLDRRCTTLQHTAAHRNTLQHIATQLNAYSIKRCRHTSTHSRTHAHSRSCSTCEFVMAHITSHVTHWNGSCHAYDSHTLSYSDSLSHTHSRTHTLLLMLHMGMSHTTHMNVSCQAYV